MPNRIVREGILSSDRVDRLDWPAEVFYRRLLSKVDDHGLYDGRLSVLRASLFPLRVDKVTDQDCSAWLQQCVDAKLLEIYEIEAKRYVHVFDTRWQARSDPKYPKPKKNNGLASNCAQLQTSARQDVDVDVVEDVVVVKPTTAKPSVPPCPHDQIVDLYNEILPMGRQVRKNLWNGTRAKHLQARWREDADRQNALWWGKLFHYCAKSPFLSGRIPPRRPGEKPFEISLDWIVEPGNFVKIIEGKYD